MILKDDTGYCCSKNSKRSEEKGYKGGSEQEFENDEEEVYVAEEKGSENPETEEEAIIEGGDPTSLCNITYLKCNEDEPIAEWIKDMHACKEREFIGKLYDTTDGKSEQKLIDTRLSDINSLKNVMCLKTVYYR